MAHIEETQQQVQNLEDSSADRERHIAQRVDIYRLEGVEPNEEGKLLHSAYIDGIATLDDLHNHAIAFAMEKMGDGGEATEYHLAADRPIYYSEDAYPNGIIREWPDGRREFVNLSVKGIIFITALRASPKSP